MSWSARPLRVARVLLGFAALAGSLAVSATHTVAEEVEPGPSDVDDSQTLVSWPSPDTKHALEQKRDDEAPEGQRYTLTLSARDGAARRLKAVARPVTVRWSPNGRFAAITNHISSDRMECLVLDILSPSRIRSVPIHLLKLKETQENSHFYASCENWTDNNLLHVRLFGHTDFSPPVYNFEYGSTYDPKARMMRLGLFSPMSVQID